MKIKTIFLIFFMGSCALVYSQADFIYDSKGRRDPFLPLVSKEGYIINRETEILASDMNLEGIIYDPRGKSLAIINGTVLKIGDTIGNYSIIEIEKNKVTLSWGNEKIILELKQEGK